jgi:hypothetical protein
MLVVIPRTTNMRNLISQRITIAATKDSMMLRQQRVGS